MLSSAEMVVKDSLEVVDNNKNDGNGADNSQNHTYVGMPHNFPLKCKLLQAHLPEVTCYIFVGDIGSNSLQIPKMEIVTPTDINNNY